VRNKGYAAGSYVRGGASEVRFALARSLMEAPLNHPRNILRFLRLLVSHPVEFCDRTEIILQARRQRRLFRKGQVTTYPERTSFADALQKWSAALGRDLVRIINEPDLQNVQSHVAKQTAALKNLGDLPFPVIYNADSTLSQLVYLFCRVLEPETVLETGVAYGVNSAVILAALYRNGKGMLHDVDLPPIADRASRRYIGTMIPAEYKSRWCLHLGASKRVLPSLFTRAISQVGVFIHDSASINRVQQWELETVWPHMAPRSALILNNIGKRAAFKNFVHEKHLKYWAAIEQREKKGDLTGVALTF
jgi:hypothetical protein